jgi:aspartate/tyrosine/aromatic aminotransferase
MFKYLASLIKNDTGNSSKSFTLVLSAIISFISGLMICSVIAYDGFKDGVIDTDLQKAGIFMLCMGGYMAGSSVSKIFGDRAHASSVIAMHEYDAMEEEGRMRRRRHGTRCVDNNEYNGEEEELDV